MNNKKVKLIFNPIANLGRAWPSASALRPLVYELGGADWSGTVYPTHATELAAQAGEEGYELVVAMGGDGTVHEVANGLMQIPIERRPRLGVVPLGSGNDFANALGVSTNSEASLRQAMSGIPRSVDIGLLTAENGRSEYWTNTLGIGFNTVVTIRSRRVPLFQGFAVYFAAVLQTILLNYDAFQLKVKTDQEEWQDELLMLTLCNGGREGGGFKVAQQAKIDDGILNYTGVRRITRPKMIATIPSFLTGNHSHLSHVVSGTFSQLSLEANKPLHIHTDGEVFSGFGTSVRNLTVKILPAELVVVC